jgi:hypothetical protein
LRCAARFRRAIGTQICAPDGDGYGACNGCSVPSDVPRPSETAAEATVGARKAEEALSVDVDVAREALRVRWAERSPFALYGAVGGSIDNPALAFSLGGRYRTGRSWLLGADAEYNPWFAFHTRRFSRGTFNFYGTVIKRFVVNEELTLRTTGHLGTSVLLFDLVGAPAGSIGPYFGVNFLGLEYELSPGLYLILDPADVALPVPHITGAPLTYLQYRLTLGVQFGA